MIEHYAEEVGLLRSKNFQANRGLLAHIDGDNHGVKKRKEQLADSLARQQIAAREDEELIAIFVPTWSIETWLAALNEVANLNETASLKVDGKCKHLWADPKAAATRWCAHCPTLPSLQDGRKEARRLGI